MPLMIQTDNQVIVLFEFLLVHHQYRRSCHPGNDTEDLLRREDGVSSLILRIRRHGFNRTSRGT